MGSEATTGQPVAPPTDLAVVIDVPRVTRDHDIAIAAPRNPLTERIIDQARALVTLTLNAQDVRVTTSHGDGLHMIHSAGVAAQLGLDQHDDGAHTSVVVVPLRHGGRSWGSMEVRRPRARAWAPDELLTAQLVGDIVANQLSLVRHVEQSRAVQEDLEHRVNHDPLTGLPNRRLLFERLQDALGDARRPDAFVAVLFIDIDEFKSINDALGHAAGDLVLGEVAKRLGACLRSSDTLARLSGDEFVIVCAGLSGTRQQVDSWLRGLGRRMQRELSRPPAPGEVEVVVTVSIGGAVGSGDTPAADLLRDADRAMYRAKRHGPGRIMINQPVVLMLADRRRPVR